MGEVYQKINQQNQALQANIIQYAEADSSDMQHTMYEMNDVATLQQVNWYLFVIFYAVAAVVCFLVLTNEGWNIYVKLAISLAILIFPFVIYTVEYGLYYLASYLYSLVTFVPFNSAYLSPYQPKTYETAFNNRYYQL
jgi:ABC-type transport system involved in cytochrome bd biosynthesis fused ATPase/permease subunit